MQTRIALLLVIVAPVLATGCGSAATAKGARTPDADPVPTLAAVVSYADWNPPSDDLTFSTGDASALRATKAVPPAAASKPNIVTRKR